MPIYTYKCKCGHDFDKLIYVGDAPKTLTCPKCGKRSKRQLSFPGHVKVQ